MKRLDKDWITSGLVDAEYKKYVLLAYLQHVKQNFDATRLYPFLSDLIEHYRDALSFRDQKQMLQSGFPKELINLDFEQLKLQYNDSFAESELLKELESIVDYALPQMQDTLEIGKDFYEEVEAKMAIEPIGIMPIYQDEGYLFLEFGRSRKTDIYRYSISNFIHTGEGVRGIYLKLIQSMKRGLGETFESMKMQLVRLYQELPNPAAFLVTSDQLFPMKETVVPITKRLVLQTVVSYEG